MILAVPLPESHPADQPTKTWVIVISSLLVVASFVIYAWIGVAGQSFSNLFAGFGADLPTLTKLTLTLDQYAIGLGLIGLVPLIALFRTRKLGSANTVRYLMWVIVSFGLSLFILGIWLASMYLPLFELGAVVS